MPTDLLSPTVTGNVGGVVLCGGKSSRMGRAKAWLEIGNETALQRVVRVLQQVVSPVVVVHAPGQSLPELSPEVLFAEDEQEHLGPLAGMARGLQTLSATVDAAYVTACDVPLLMPEFVRKVISEIEGFDCAVPRDEQFYHPLAGVYRTSLAETAEKLVGQGNLRPLYLIEQCRCRPISLDMLQTVDAQLESLRNINTPEDYAAVLEIIREKEQA